MDAWRIVRLDPLIEEQADDQLAIVSNSKHFLSLPLIQHLVKQIYTGHLVYSPISSRALISDSYISDRTRLKRRPSHSSLLSHSHSPPHAGASKEEEELVEVYTYNPYESGWLDHQRLRVPKWRKWLDFTSFVMLLSLFVATLARESSLLLCLLLLFITRPSHTSRLRSVVSLPPRRLCSWTGGALHPRAGADW